MSDQQGFLPADYVETRRARRTNIISLLLFAVVMGGVVVIFFIRDQRDNLIRNELASVNAKFEQAAKQIEQVEILHEQRREMLQKAEITGQLIQRPHRTSILAELVNRTPSNMDWLELKLQARVLARSAASAKTRLQAARAARNGRAAPGGPAAPAEAAEPIPMEIDLILVGLAPTDVQVAQFMRDLTDSAMFASLDLKYSEETELEDQTVRKFRIEMKVNRALDPREFEVLRVQRDLRMNPMSDDTHITPQRVLLGPDSPHGEEGEVVIPDPPIHQVAD